MPTTLDRSRTDGKNKNLTMAMPPKNGLSSFGVPRLKKHESKYHERA
jgi:hypothetical protein